KVGGSAAPRVAPKVKTSRIEHMERDIAASLVALGAATPGYAAQGTPPSRMRASLLLSILPPETMHTILPPPARPVSAAAQAAAPAPSATTWLRSASSLMAAAISASDTTSEPASRACASGHISASTLLPPMPSTKLGVYDTDWGAPAASEAASGAAVSTSAAKTRTPGLRARTAEAMPDDKPPPP